jgi:Zn-dependent alcohol dehydrogenase
MIKNSRLNPRTKVTHRCKLADVKAAIAAMRAGEAVHTLIHF